MIVVISGACQQLEIWNRFNPHKISNFTTLSFPFIWHYSIPLILIHHEKLKMCATGTTRDNISTNLCCKLDVVDLYILSGPNQKYLSTNFLRSCFILFFYPSSKEIGCQWVLFLNSSKTANPNELEFWDMISLWEMVIG